MRVLWGHLLVHPHGALLKHKIEIVMGARGTTGRNSQSLAWEMWRQAGRAKDSLAKPARGSSFLPKRKHRAQLAGAWLCGLMAKWWWKVT